MTDTCFYKITLHTFQLLSLLKLEVREVHVIYNRYGYYVLLLQAMRTVHSMKEPIVYKLYTSCTKDLYTLWNELDSSFPSISKAVYK